MDIFAELAFIHEISTARRPFRRRSGSPLRGKSALRELPGIVATATFFAPA